MRLYRSYATRRSGIAITPAFAKLCAQKVVGVPANFSDTFFSMRAALATQSDWVFAGQLDDLRDPNSAAPRTLRELLLAGDVTAAVRAAAACASEGGA